METLYFFVARRVMAKHSRFWMWMYVRVAVANQIKKHLQRGNWELALRYLTYL